jgi:hypothetical protein
VSNALHCPRCLADRARLILYAIGQDICAVCGCRDLLPHTIPGSSSEPLTATMVLADPAASRWLTEALKSALLRDPVDAANDADVLAQILDRRCRLLLEQAVSERTNCETRS